MAGFVIVFEHLLPLLMVRRDPEQVLIRLLPTFKLLERPIRPITLGAGRPHRDVAAGCATPAPWKPNRRPTTRTTPAKPRTRISRPASRKGSSSARIGG